MTVAASAMNDRLSRVQRSSVTSRNVLTTRYRLPSAACTGVRRDHRPAHLARGNHAEADQLVGGFSPPSARRPGRSAKVIGCAALVEQLEARQDVGDRRRQELLAVLEAAQLGGRVVGIDQLPVRRLDGDALVDAGQDRRQLVARRAQLVVETQAIDGRGEYVGHRLQEVGVARA